MNRTIIHTALLQAITPIHISHWENISKFDYILDGNEICIINTNKLLEKMNIRQLSSLEEKIINKALDTALNTLQLYSEVDENIKNKIECIRKVKARNLTSNVDIRKFIRYNDKPDTAYIPGSTIKGYIRTVYFFYRILGNPTEKKSFFEMIKGLKNKDIKVSGIWGLYHRQLVGDDTSKDPFRKIKISDSNTIKDNKLMVIRANRYHLLKKRIGVPLYLETILGSTEINEMKITMEEGSPFSSMQDLCNKLNNFANEMINFELATRWGMPRQLRKFYEHIRIQIEELDKERECLLRIGYGTQFYTKTLWMLFWKEKRPDFAYNVFKNLKLKNKPRIYISNATEFPITRVIWQRTKDEWYPLGWLKMRIK